MKPTWPQQLDGFAPPLNQIAFSVVDLRLTERWFREGFGLLPAGGSRALMRGPLAANVQGLPRAASTCWWLLGRNSWFQLELFQFERPIAKLMPADFRPCDIGYTRIGIWVEDFDATLKRLAGLGSQPLTAPLGRAGQAARLRPQPRRGLCRNHGRRPAAAIQPAWARRLPGGDPFGDVVGAPVVRCRSIFRRRALASRPAPWPCIRQSTRRCGAWRAPRRRADCSTAARC